MISRLHIGTAGWSIPKAVSDDFPRDGSHLQRYAQRLNGVEINSSFYRPHKPDTYARWAAAVPEAFRFSVKMPRSITHELRLSHCGSQLDRFLEETSVLRQKLGCVLVQLPPSLRFDAAVMGRFLKMLRRRFEQPCVCEPRHETWFGANADQLLAEFDIGRVAADPALVPSAASPGGSTKIVYYRLHGSPRMYYSNYDDAYLKSLAAQLRIDASVTDAWCIFDNTAAGFALSNALDLQRASQTRKR
jgi:uncharacterized protein YecE (DUF72 family)